MLAPHQILPFLRWFPLSRSVLRADAIAGTTVALILIPQSMAYAQLAGMPAYYGLYAAFLPVIVGALWGSSHQLATGPVAMVSLLTGSTLAQFASPGSEQFIAYAILLAFMVGLMQLALGAFRLGAVINFLSHPVVVGFTNAAAIIIALSQINRMLGVPIGRSEHFLVDIWIVLQQLGDTHVPTLVMSLSALILIVLLRRYRPKWPGVLITVAATTAVSWAIQFERNVTADFSQFEDAAVRSVIESVAGTASRMAELNAELETKSGELKKIEKPFEGVSPRTLVLSADIEILRLEVKTLEREHRLRMRELRRFVFERAAGPRGADPRFHLVGTYPSTDKDPYHWRITKAAPDGLQLSGGGEVVGRIPSGLPTLSWPTFDWSLFVTLLASALVITLVGFMEAISIAKAMATRTRQRIDPNQELIGQGLANLVGSLSQSFPVSGSFSRSAVNVSAGAVTGMSSVFTGALVLVTLLLFTPLLYHLPQAVLAAIIMMAVVNLVNLKAMRHAWEAQRHDGVAAIVTFVATLGFAPHLDTGILIGAGLAIVLFLYRTMRPRVAVLGRHPDGTLRDARLHQLPTSEHIIVIRFDGSLYFANVPYFEDAVLQEAARSPRAKYILVVGDGINEIDGSGEEAIRHMAERLKDSGITMVFSGLKMQVLRVMERTGLHALIGTDCFFRTEDAALEAIYQRIDDPSFDPKSCPLSGAQ
ncbi:MAG: STAS domain-containing protein [Betaproteobacteria bacterium]|nr:STAS domain-containing protein [Betaproteobacteria bacterium]